MRILRALFVYSLACGILMGVGFLVGREVILFMAVSQVRASLNTIRKTASNTGAYIQQCREKGIIDDSTSAIGEVQLRFVSPTSYVLEVICSQFALDPIVIETKELPMFVTKTAGSSGSIYGETLTGIGLEVFGRSRGIFMQGRDIWYDQAAKTVGLAGPVTSCSGHGYACCQVESSQGVGATLTNVTDCSLNCYQSCSVRPIVLSVTTQPFYDLQTRQVATSEGMPIEVGYVVDDQGAKSMQVSIDFGDGTSENFAQNQAKTSHAYTCAQTGQASCEYQITITAVNDEGISSVVTRISQVSVVVAR